MEDNGAPQTKMRKETHIPTSASVKWSYRGNSAPQETGASFLRGLDYFIRLALIGLRLQILRRSIELHDHKLTWITLMNVCNQLQITKTCIMGLCVTKYIHNFPLEKFTQHYLLLIKETVPLQSRQQILASTKTLSKYICYVMATRSTRPTKKTLSLNVNEP